MIAPVSESANIKILSEIVYYHRCMAPAVSAESAQECPKSQEHCELRGANGDHTNLLELSEDSKDATPQTQSPDKIT